MSPGLYEFDGDSKLLITIVSSSIHFKLDKLIILLRLVEGHLLPGQMNPEKRTHTAGWVLFLASESKSLLSSCLLNHKLYSSIQIIIYNA